MIRPLTRPFVAAIAALLLITMLVVPAAAWSNGPSAGGVTGNGYGTHDWIIDQALRTFNGKPPSWLNASTARQASDDPDTLFWKTNEHVYMEAGYGRGAVYLVTEYYAKAINDLKRGDNHQASIDVGRMAHYWGDLYVPFHTAYAAVSKTSAHNAYEHLVDARNRSSGSAPDWVTADRSPETVANVRTMAIAAAAYSRGFYGELYAEFSKNTSVLNARVSAITGYVLKKASRELGDLINSIGKQVGNAPPAAKLVVTRKYSQPSSIEYQAIYIKVTDGNGKPIEGARVDVTWPSSADVPNGAEPTAHVFRAYTMADGVAKATAYIDLGLHGSKLTVKIAVNNRGQTLSTTTWYQAK